MPGIVSLTPPFFKLGVRGNFFNNLRGLIKFDLCENNVNECTSPATGSPNSTAVPLSINDLEEYNFINCALSLNISI